PPYCAQSAVEVRSLRDFEVREETADPGRQVLFEQLAVGAWRAAEAAGRKARHDLAEDGGMVLRLRLAFDALDAEPREIVTQARQRPFIQEAGEVERTVGHEFASSDADEKIEELALDPLRIRHACRLGKRPVHDPERSGIAA